MSPRSISAVDIQSHLYSSFLQGRTADVALNVSGRWRAVYHLHRVVLIQSDFFRSLFTSGFREASQDSRNRRRGADEIDIVFDDTNITRAAFELCLSRLYGGGPMLHLPPSLIPSTAQPLSSSFVNGILPESVPEGHHPATPHFLLSLLATSVYLSIPSVASQALSMIFKTIGPYTVIPYLNFALGKSIDRGAPLWEGPETAVGLEDVAEILDHEERIPSNPDNSSRSSPTQDKEGFSEFEVTSGCSEVSEDDSDFGGSSHHYGPISDKIGEACACWLVRWASDMLSFERDREPRDTVIPPSNPETNVAEQGTYTIGVLSPQGPYIWGRGGLNPMWVSSLISADTFFVKNELARYDFAKSAVEFRRKDGIIASEETCWDELFKNGIYYANMSVEDIIAISRDVSPTTNKPYVSMLILKTALWSQSLLRHQITHRPPSSPGSTASPPPRDKEIGIAIATQELKNHVNQEASSSEFYYPALVDSSLRLGDNGNDPQGHSDGTVLSMEDLFQFSHSPIVSLARRSTPETGSGHKVHIKGDARISSSEETLFGLKGERYTVEECIAADPSGKRRWTPFPPQRFGVEFWDIDSLKEKSRLHSHTIWHAGSLYNIYIQIVKKKGQAQLGIYLHRQSSIELIPPSSAPCPSFSRILTEEPLSGEESSTNRPRGSSVVNPMFSGMAAPSSPTLHSNRSLNALSQVHIPASSSISPPSSPFLSSTPTNYGTHSSTSISIPFTTNGVTPAQQYRDHRSSVSAYFSISCASASGSSQMRFTSAPDVFSVSQSWGWKTSALRTEEYMEIRSESSSTPVTRSPIKSLRATVVLGLI